MGTALQLGLFCLLIGTSFASTPCVLPKGSPGLCVPLEGCSNLFAYRQLATQVSAKIEQYLNRVKCVIPEHGASGVCCEPRRVFQLPEQCGVISNDRIANGNVTLVFEHPWMALLMYRNRGTGDLVGACGGTLISDRYVLTAGHCVAGLEPNIELAYVRLGEHTISTELDCNTYSDSDETDCADDIENIKVESTEVHHSFNSTPFSDDVGLLRLAEKVVFKDHIKPICLPMSQHLINFPSERYTVTGWGVTSRANLRSDVLMKAVIPAHGIDECQRRLDELPRGNQPRVVLTSKQLCAGGKDRVDTCVGDSGGPLMAEAPYRNKTRTVQFGIVSFGVTRCGTMNFPGIYVNVGSYLGWIMSKMYV